MVLSAGSKRIVKKKARIVKKKAMPKAAEPVPSTSDEEEMEEDEQVEKEVEEAVVEEMEGEENEEEEDEKEAAEAEDDDFDSDLEAFDDEEEETETAPVEKNKSGVLYFPSIPPKFTPTRLKEYFEKFAPGKIGRVYLERNKHSKSIDNRYKEGWLEVKRKKLAKRLAGMVDSQPVGGKKRDPTSSVLWNIKYLSGFKWFHLVEQLDYEKTVHNKRMSAEVSQARRVAAHFEEQVEKGERLKKLEEKVLKQGGKWEKFQRQVTQKKTFRAKKKAKKTAAKEADLMSMIFAE